MNNSGEENKEEFNNTPEGSVFDQPVEHMDEHPAEPTPPAEPPVVPQPVTEPFQPLPEASAPPVTSAPVAVKKSHKGLIATIIALAVLLLAAAGYIVYTSFFAKKADEAADTTPTTSATQTQTPASPDAQAVIDTVRTAIINNLAKSYPQMSIKDSTIAPAYKADDVAYAVSSTSFGHGFDIIPEKITPTSGTSSATKFEQVIADSFVAQTGFTKSSLDWETTYQNNSVICVTSISSVPVSLYCADKSAYADLITSIKPFATAYLASSDGKKNGDGILLFNPQITQKVSGYSKAVVSMGNTNSPIGGYAGLFYAKDGNWTYWRGTQSEIDCSEYNTHDLQMAFEGDTCYDTATKGNTTVKVSL